MTLTHKKQLTWLCATAILGGTFFQLKQIAQAQYDPAFRTRNGVKEPRLALTRDEAARQFLALLKTFNERFTSVAKPDAAMLSSFSRSSENENLSALLNAMARQINEPEQKVTTQNEGNKTAIVVVETSPTLTSRPLVMVQEGDGWGVDVLETYAKWNGLEGAAKIAAVAALKADLEGERETARRASCQSNLKQIALGVAQYVQDYDAKLPPARPWIDAVMPYLKNEQIFTCPSVKDPKGYGYAYNSKLSTKNFLAVSTPSQTVSLYETSTLKRNAYGLGENLAFRHQNGANYAFVDGHVKWFDKTAIPSFKLKP